MSTEPLTPREPDSDFGDGIGADRRIEVFWTDESDFPSGGSVTVRLRFSKYQSTTLRITKAEARSALEQLAALLGAGVALTAEEAALVLGRKARVALQRANDERFCDRCYAGVYSNEHHEECVVTGHAEDGESA